MRRAIVSAVLFTVAFTGCELSRSARQSANREFMNTSKVTGVIALPEGMSSDACDRLTVAASYVAPEAGAQATVGHVSVHQSRNRCFYEVDELPADAALHLDVKSEGEWKCSNGAQASFAPDGQQVTLKNDQTLTQDFKASCSQS